MLGYPITIQDYSDDPYPHVLYEHVYCLIRETKKPKYLDFFALDAADLRDPRAYLEQTIRYAGKWFFVTTGKQIFKTVEARDAAPKIYIKFLRKPKAPFKI